MPICTFRFSVILLIFAWSFPLLIPQGSNAGQSVFWISEGGETDLRPQAESVFNLARSMGYERVPIEDSGMLLVQKNTTANRLFLITLRALGNGLIRVEAVNAVNGLTIILEDIPNDNGFNDTLLSLFQQIEESIGKENADQDHLVVSTQDRVASEIQSQLLDELEKELSQSNQWRLASRAHVNQVLLLQDLTYSGMLNIPYSVSGKFEVPDIALVVEKNKDSNHLLSISVVRAGVKIRSAQISDRQDILRLVGDIEATSTELRSNQ